MEQANIAFTTLLGSAVKADAFLRKLQAFAATTPFEFPELQTAASSLISIGIDAEKVIPIMTTLGNVTSGMGTGAEGFKRATVAIQQMNAAGRITAEDLWQLRDAGIPVFDLLAGATGKTTEQLAEMANSGKLGRQELEQLMTALETGKGLERFNGLMAAQSQSLKGMASTFKDAVQLNLAEAMQPFIPGIKRMMSEATPIIDSALNSVAQKSTVLVQQVPNLFAAIAERDAQGIGEVLDNIFGNTGDKVDYFRSKAEQILPVIDQAKELFANLWQIAGHLGPALGAVGDSVQVAWEIFKFLLPILVQITGFLAENKELVIGLAVAYGTLRAAMIAHQAAQAVSTAGGVVKWLTAWIGQMKIAQSVQKAWTAVQWLFNAAMNANPIVKIVSIIGLLVGALVAAYQNSETFRNIVDGALHAVGAAASWLWNDVLSPVWNAIKTGWDAVVTGIQWAWQNILKPVFDVLGTVAQALGIFLMVVVFGPIMLAWKVLTEGIKLYWEHVLKPTFELVADVAVWLWQNVLSPTFDGIKAGWNGVITGIQWAWQNILQPTWNALQIAARWLWDNVLAPVFAGIAAGWSGLLTGIDWSYENVLKPTWDAISVAAGWLWNTILKPIFDAIGTGWSGLFNGMKSVWDNVLSPVFSAFGRALDVIKDSFNTAVEWIGKVWDGMRQKLMSPIQWVVDFVWNNGLRKLWNWINNLWGGDDLEAFRLDAATGAVVPTNLGRAGGNRAYATGGVLPGYTPGRDVHRFVSPTGGILNLSGGEAIMRPEFTRVMGVHGVNALNAAARTGGLQGVADALAARSQYEQSHKDGGIISLPGWLSTALEYIPGAGIVTDAINAINGGKGWGAGQWSDALIGTVKQVGSKIWEKVKSWFDSDSGTYSAKKPSPPGVNGLGPMAKAAREFVMRTWGIQNIGGYANRNIAGTNTPSDHALGKAIDVMIPNYQSAASINLGNNIANWFTANPAKFGTKYVIWRDHINSGRGWEPYGHPGGGRNDTLQHRDHVHVSLYDQGGVLEPGLTPVLNKTGKPEAVFTHDEWGVFKSIAAGGGNAPLVGGDLILQVGEGASVRDQMEEAMFQLRRIKRGGALR
ncbi:tape measure domain-containing protein [Kibdelosporangium banguiense]|uniref:Tape measure domain-containing protein n=2 Tax=Kibdelosporangium banguiense TaxID=1365924 RepID=A0ABS4TG14_9PSEU|nr:tape measure domain-containing protein [Kibdelosporangium banguiense]